MAFCGFGKEPLHSIVPESSPTQLYLPSLRGNCLFAYLALPLSQPPRPEVATSLENWLDMQNLPAKSDTEGPSISLFYYALGIQITLHVRPTAPVHKP